MNLDTIPYDLLHDGLKVDILLGFIADHIIGL